eukprot:175581-Chlamydomonas_euryale.AAC.1
MQTRSLTTQPLNHCSPPPLFDLVKEQLRESMQTESEVMVAAAMQAATAAMAASAGGTGGGGGDDA